jgi:hypothetical protein
MPPTLQNVELDLYAEYTGIIATSPKPALFFSYLESYTTTFNVG